MRSFLIGVFLLTLSLPLLLGVLRSYGHISPRASLQIKNKTGSEIREVTILEPDIERTVGFLDVENSTVTYYYPDYAEYNGKRYPGISDNYLIFKCEDRDLKLNLPIIHPGEIHEITITKNFELQDKHLNKIETNK